MLGFRQNNTILLEIPPLKTQNIYMFRKFWVGHGSLGSLWLRICTVVVRLKLNNGPDGQIKSTDILHWILFLKAP